ncbi:MAG: putative molybdenum carrier protein [Kiritimatiellae bacterium]|nr:putative molybdenum carrier protein [Kiritimatiellia bacterium]
MIPRGRRAELSPADVEAGREEGLVPLCFDQMVEAFSPNYLYRTEQNVRRSDATLIIDHADSISRQRGFKVPDNLTGGTLKTWRFAIEHRKPCLVMTTANIPSVLKWLAECREKGRVPADRGVVLNVAGPRESRVPGIQVKTKSFVMRLIKAVRAAEEQEAQA